MSRAICQLQRPPAGRTAGKANVIICLVETYPATSKNLHQCQQQKEPEMLRTLLVVRISITCFVKIKHLCA